MSSVLGVLLRGDCRNGGGGEGWGRWGLGGLGSREVLVYKLIACFPKKKETDLYFSLNFFFFFPKNRGFKTPDLAIMAFR